MIVILLYHIMSGSQHLFRDLIQTLEEENKSKIHQIFLITEELNRIIIINRDLCQKEASLILINSQQKNLIDIQQDDIKKLRQIIHEMQKTIVEQEDIIKSKDLTTVDFKSKQNKFLNTFGQESIYNLLNTNNFQQFRQLNQTFNQNSGAIEQNIKLRHQIIQSDCIIRQLQHNLQKSEVEINNLKADQQNIKRQHTQIVEKQQLKSQYSQSKILHLTQTITILESRNNEFSEKIKGLSEEKYHLEIQVNSIRSMIQSLEKELNHFKFRSSALEEKLKLKSDFQNQQKKEINNLSQKIFVLESQFLKVKNQNILLTNEHNFLKTELENAINSKVDLQVFQRLQKENSDLVIQLSLVEQQLNNKNDKILLKQQLELQISIQRAYQKQQISHLKMINLNLNSQIKSIKQKLQQQQSKNKEISRLENLNKSLFKRIDRLECSFDEEKRKSLKNVGSLMNIPSTTSIPSIPSRTRIQPTIQYRPNLIRMKSEENILRSRNLKEPIIRQSSRIKNIFSSRELQSDAPQKYKWRDLQGRIQSLKVQNQDMRKHLALHKL